MPERFLPDADTTTAIGARLAESLPSLPSGRAALVWLEGGLGAGKTTLVRGFLRAMGVTGSVRSPTYTLLEPYEPAGAAAVYHLDLYRLADPSELEMLGLRDLAGEAALVMVEWPERGAGWLPAADLRVRLTAHDAGRRLVLEAGSDWGAAWLAAFDAVMAGGNDDNPAEELEITRGKD